MWIMLLCMDMICNVDIAFSSMTFLLHGVVC